MLMTFDPFLQIKEIFRSAFLTVLIEFHLQQSMCRKQRQGTSLISPGEGIQSVLLFRIRLRFHCMEVFSKACLWV